MGVLAGREIFEIVRIARHGSRAKGRIVRDEIAFVPYARARMPIVRFHDDAGVAHEFKSRFAKNTSYREQSEDVVVAYDPKSPVKSAVVLEVSHFLPTAFSLMIFYLVTVSLLILFLWKASRG
jgi:hypothetical protein